MAENDAPASEPAEGDAVPSPTETTVDQAPVAEPAPAAPAAPAGPRFTDRVWNFRAMVAVALAALLLGGGVGAAITAVSQDDGPDRRPGFTRFGDGPPGFPGDPGRGLDRQQRQQFRQDLKDMRQWMRQRLENDAPTPSPPSPSPSRTS